MNWLKTTILIATMLVLLGIDALIGLSGTLYMPPIAGFGLVAFIVAVPLLIATGQGLLLFLQHNAALGYFLIQGVRDGVQDGLMEFTGIAIGINVLLAVILLVARPIQFFSRTWDRCRDVCSHGCLHVLCWARDRARVWGPQARLPHAGAAISGTVRRLAGGTRPRKSACTTRPGQPQGAPVAQRAA